MQKKTQSPSHFSTSGETPKPREIRDSLAPHIGPFLHPDLPVRRHEPKRLHCAQRSADHRSRLHLRLDVLAVPFDPYRARGPDAP